MMDRDEVEERFKRALNTLFALPDRVGPSGFKTGWPPYAREYMDAYDPDHVIRERFEPTPQDISTFLDVLAWGRDVDRLGRQLLIWKAIGASFRQMGDILDVSHEFIRQRYNDAVDQIWSAANAETL